MGLPVLVLNRLARPVRITSLPASFQASFHGRCARVDAEGEPYELGTWAALPVRIGVDDAMPVVTGAIRVPRVIQLRRYDRLWSPSVRLTRRNLMLRDGYRCQYCGRTADSAASTSITWCRARVAASNRGRSW